MSTETPEESRRRARRSAGWYDQVPTHTGHYLWSDGSGDKRPRYCWVTVWDGRFKDRPVLVEGDWGRANAVDMGGFWLQAPEVGNVPTKTDLSLLEGADTILMGNDAVDAGIALNDAVAELRALRKLVAAKKPVCPHCKTAMKVVKYEGYYDSFTYWGCDCVTLPDVVETWKGGYA